MENLKHTKSQKLRGFTIVELLIVIIVIGVLAAIIIVAYNNIQAKAKTGAANSAALQANKKIMLYQVENGSYPLSNNLVAAGITNSTSTNYQYTSDGTTYCLTASFNGVSYKVSNNSTPQPGVCAGQIDGGIITNLHPNPGAMSTTGYSNYAGLSPNTSTASSVAASWSTSGSAYRATWTNGSATTQGDIGIYVNANSTLTAGNTYTLRYRIMANQASTIGSAGIWATNGVYSITASSASSTSVAAGVPLTRWVTFTGDAAALSSGLRIVQTPTIATGNSYEISDVTLYDGAYNSSIGFAWGNSTGWSWNGAVNNSTSTGPM